MMIHGDAIGVLNCYTEKVHNFSKEEQAILQAIATQAALAVEHAKLTVKGAVIQEMHHRVKNNLQQIASLVRLQMHFARPATGEEKREGMDDNGTIPFRAPSTEEALTDCLNRILAIAAVHELLSRDDLDTVSVKKVAEQILTATKQSVIAPGKTVNTKVDGPDIRLSLNHATSLALVINELVQNAVEHGFRDLDEGRIEVGLEVRPLPHDFGHDEEIILTVANDGESLPADFDAARPKSLGLRIVNDLVRGGLGGSFTMQNHDGILATVRFPR